MRNLSFGVRFYIAALLSFLMTQLWIKAYTPGLEDTGNHINAIRSLLSLTQAIMSTIYLYYARKALRVFLRRIPYIILTFAILAASINTVQHIVTTVQIGSDITGWMVIANVIFPLLLAFAWPALLYAMEWFWEIPWVHARLFGQGASGRFGTIRTLVRSMVDWREGFLTPPVHGVQSGKIYFGHSNIQDDPFPRHVAIEPSKHVITIAQTRSGKSTSMGYLNDLTCNLSMVIFDPKGEHARNTFYRRCSKEFLEAQNIQVPETVTRHFKHARAYVFDPWGITGLPSICINPMDAIDLNDPNVGTILRAISSGCVIREAGSNGTNTHFNDMAQSVLEAFMVFVKDEYPQDQHNLGTVYDLLFGINEDGFADPKRLDETLNFMLTCDAVGGLAQTTAMTILALAPKERSGVFSTVSRSIKWVSDPAVRPAISRSDLDMTTFGNKMVDTPNGPVRLIETLYICIPDEQLDGQLVRFVRVELSVDITLLRRSDPLPQKYRIILIDEPAKLKSGLGPLTEGLSILSGSKLCIVLCFQNISQMAEYYPKTYEEMLGNSNVQYFGVALNDLKTRKTVSEVIGKRYRIRRKSTQKIWDLFKGGTVAHETPVDVIAPEEVAKYLASTDNKQILIPAAGHPLRLSRVAFKRMTINGKRYGVLGRDGLKGHFSDDQSTSTQSRSTNKFYSFFTLKTKTT